MNSALKAAWQGAEQTKPAAAISSGWGNAENDATYTVIDAETSIPHNEPMSTVTKDLLDARLEATEARMDARVAGMSAKLDTALAEMRADREANNVRFASMAKDIGDIKSELSGTKASFKTVVGNVWGAAVATITIVAAIVGFGLAAFDSGRETSKNIAEATAQMKQLQMQLEAQAKAVSASPTPAATPPQ